MVMEYTIDGDGGSGGVLSVGDVPRVDTDGAALLSAAETLESAAGSLRDGGESAATTWGGLSSVYTASGTEPLYGKLNLASTHADQVGSALERAALALSEFALAVPTLQYERDSLVSRIGSVREVYFGSDPESAEGMTASGNLARLESEVGSFAARVEQAEQDCIDALASISGGTTNGIAPSANLADGATYSEALSTAITQTATPIEQLEMLANMSPQEVEDWFQRHPEFASVLATAPPPAEDVATWWASVEAAPDGSALAAALILGMPTALGNLNGVPYWARSEANLIVLDQEIAQAYEDLARAEPGVTANIPSQEHADIMARLTGLLAIADSLGGRGSYDLAAHQLIELHVDGNLPLAAVSSGNLDEADYLSVLVPGMNSPVADALPGMVQNGDSLLAAQQTALDASESVGAGEGDLQAAVLSWVGYTTPDMATVFGNDHAVAGAPLLAETLGGLDATLTSGGPGGFGPYTSVIMHSYGGTTGSLTLSDGDYDVDNALFLNSPGVIIESADQMNVGAVWAATPPDDSVVDVGNLQEAHPVLPLDPEFGATVYDVPETGAGSIYSHNLEHHFADLHGGQYQPGEGAPGQALQQLVSITLGEGALTFGPDYGDIMDGWG